MTAPEPDGAIPSSHGFGAGNASARLKGIVGRGSARNGLAHITLGDQGLVDEVVLDPRIRRLDSRDLADYVREAIIAAQHDYGRQASKIAAAVEAENTQRLRRKLSELDIEYQRRMDEFEHMMDDIIRLMDDRPG